MKNPVFSSGQIESLAHFLGDCGTGSEITNSLEACQIEDISGKSIKWRRLNVIFLKSQRQYQSYNHILKFIKFFLDPVRFIRKKEDFENRRQNLNEILAFSGLEYRENGNFCHVEPAKTLDEAEKRVQTIRSKFKGRNVHLEVLKYCRREVMQNNPCHAVFETTKGLAQRIREMSQVQEDGTALVDQVFSIKNPILAFNTLRTKTEKSEQKGFSSLLKGCFSAVRNPLAHQPKILWKGEDDIIDYFSLISFLHRKLDNYHPTQPRVS